MVRGRKERQVEAATSSLYPNWDAFRNNQGELFEPGTYLQDDARPGWFSILYRSGIGISVKQVTYPIAALAPVVQTINRNYDTWISQAIFDRPSRRAVYLRDIGLFFADLDTYNLSALRGLSPEAQVALLLSYCAQEGIPAPSIVMYSGRGLQAKWLLDAAMPRSSVLRWAVVENALIDALKGFAADSKARDVSRVLRLERTVNLKSMEITRVVHITGTMESPARYCLDDFEGLVARHDATRNNTCALYSVRSRRIIEGRSLAELDWARLEDIRRLWAMRGGCREGFREETLFWMVNWLVRASPVSVSEFYREAAALAAEIYPGTWYKESDLTTIYRKAQEYRAGKDVEYNGKQYPALYTPRNDTLINIFEISGEEQKHLLTIIDTDEKVRRRREKRWAAGTKQQPGWARTKPWEAFGISRATWFRRGKPTPPTGGPGLRRGIGEN